MVGLGSHGQVASLGSCGLMGKLIGVGLNRMVAVAANPVPTNRPSRTELEEFAPEFLVLQLETAAVSPSVTSPAEDEKAHSVDQQFGVRAQFDLGADWRQAQCLNCGAKFHFGNG